MESHVDAAVLRCWKCRKCIIDSRSLLTKRNAGGENVPVKCSIWHVSIEALPDWIIGHIEEAQWTIGKLNCLYCGARLGGFNFVSSAKCPCGQDVTIHLCKSRTDYEAKHLLPITRPPSKGAALFVPKSLDGLNTQQGMEARVPGLSSTMFSHAVIANNEIGRIAEALCLEARSCRGDFKAANPQAFSSFSGPLSARCVVKASHRKAHSLDYSSTDGMGISISFSDLLKAYACDSSRSGRLQTVIQPHSQRASLHLVTGATSGTLYPNRVSSDVDREPDRSSQRAVMDTEGRTDHPGESNAQVLVGNSTTIRTVALRRRFPSESSTEEEQVTSADSLLQTGPSTSPTAERRLSKRERNRLKSLRRKQRRRERWIESQLQERNKQSSTGNLTSSDDEDVRGSDKDGYMCAVCLDVYFSPYMCYPCHHIFCEPCLRTLAKDNPTNTPCPLCRTIITRVFFQTDLNHTTKTFFPKEYLSRKQNFQKTSCAKWPLPSCRKMFRIFGGFRRHADRITQRQFPHGGYRLDSMDFEDDSRGWRFDMDMVIIYIYSVNWVIGFIIFCFLCYFFFPSF
ncbi:E3 ubiquitin-protein ligase RNF180-like [Huso huso]|uniref:E3 ubiquitin-protein ligase RNF180-like n=1 Tax=Huso huso TaxID=61971 RepID=A0ABR1ADM0_HUSHU